MPDSRKTHEERRERLFAQLVEEYKERFPASCDFQEQASTRLIDGGSHGLRLFRPFPCWVRAAQGAYIYDVDGRAILDFWQGHFANILGHNPPEITEPLAEALRQGRGLQSGMQDVWERELADLLCQRVGTEMVRFTTSGSLATMYAILLARVHTGRDLVLKVGGGWHGAQPWGLKGVHFGPEGYQGAETEGLPEYFLSQVLVTGFNDAEEEVSAVVDFLNGLARPVEYELLPYHGFGAPKYEQLGLEYALQDLSPPSPERMEALRDRVRRRLRRP